MILLSIKLQIWVILLCRFLTFSLNTWFCVTLKIDAIISVVSSFHCYVFCIWPILQQMTWFNWVDVITQTFSTCIQASVPEWSCSLVNCIISCRWITSLLCLLFVSLWMGQKRSASCNCADMEQMLKLTSFLLLSFARLIILSSHYFFFVFFSLISLTLASELGMCCHCNCNDLQWASVSPAVQVHSRLPPKKGRISKKFGIWPFTLHLFPYSVAFLSDLVSFLWKQTVRKMIEASFSSHSHQIPKLWLCFISSHSQAYHKPLNVIIFSLALLSSEMYLLHQATEILYELLTTLQQAVGVLSLKSTRICICESAHAHLYWGMRVTKGHPCAHSRDRKWLQYGLPWTLLGVI